MIPNYELIREGKVRKLYDFDSKHMIFFTTDRISAFDVVLPDLIPGKGGVLTRLSKHWMTKFSNIVDNHLTDLAIDSPLFGEPGEAIIVKKVDPLPVEAIVRGYLIGSGWDEYLSTGMVCDIPLPPRLRLAERLREPIFTPSTKAEIGDHDENINFDTVVDLIGYELADQVRDVSLSLFRLASMYAAEQGILIADTKFEFGIDPLTGKLTWIDEALTPDSSRFWDAERYQVGVSPESYDKQIVRDYLKAINWDKNPPAPHLPQEIIDKTAQKYREVEDKLT